MAVYTATVNVGTSSASTTLTGWGKFVSITVPAGAANPVYVTTDGSTPTVGGADCVMCPIGTTVIKNRTEAPEITATTPGATDPSAVGTLQYPGTKVSYIGAAAVTGVTVSLLSSAGTSAIVG